MDYPTGMRADSRRMRHWTNVRHLVGLIGHIAQFVLRLLGHFAELVFRRLGQLWHLWLGQFVQQQPQQHVG